MSDAGAGPLGPGGVASIQSRFQRHLEDRVAGPIRSALDRYVDELQDAIVAMDEPDGDSPDRDVDPDESATREPDGADGSVDEAARTAAEERFRYATRFSAHFGDSFFDGAREARDALFQAFDDVSGAPDGLPDSVQALNGDDSPAAPDLVRPSRARRLVAAVTRPAERTIPVRDVAELILADLSRRLQPLANDVARLPAVATAVIRERLHERTELGREDDEPVPTLADARAAIISALDERIDETASDFGRAIRARTIQVPDGKAETVRDRAAEDRADLREDWAAFQTTLMANVASEGVLARTLGAMESTVATTARELERIRDHRGVEPLERLVDGLARLGDRAEDELAEGVSPAVLESLAVDAMRLFDDELSRVIGLRERLEERIDAAVAELAGIPTGAPDDLRISVNPIDRIPDRSRTLQLRDAPLEELLATACTGTLPRWLEKSMSAAGEELDAMDRELQRVRNAVEFQLKAPLRGGFTDRETRTLVAGIIERTVGQLEDLRAQGFVSVDSLVEGLEERGREEADTLRSAVAERDFMRIRSEIAEEEVARQISTGLAWAKGLASSVGRGVRKVWTGAGRLLTAVRDWAQRRLGVGEVERAAMIASLEQSLLGEGRQVAALPAMYRQLFDVEAGVPWDELLVGRDDELQVIRKAYDRWCEDRSATLAVVGEKGSGKSTLVRLARQRVFSDTPVREVELDRSLGDLAELERRLARAFDIDTDGPLVQAINAQPPSVAVVEDLHNLFIRTLGGFDALEAFLEVMTATSHNVLWVITVDELAWRYLNRVVGIKAHFVHSVSTTNLSPEMLERAIMARHEVSGFALRFETETEQKEPGRWARLLGRKAQGELTRKESRRQLFFRELGDIAEGNIVLGLFYWLRSIKRMDEHVLVLGDPEIIDLEFLEQIPLDQLHTIAAAILHGGLSQATHQRIFQIPAAQSRLQLAALADAHMVFLADDGEYKINKVLYRPFIRLLKSKNIF